MHLAHLSALDDITAGIKALDRLTRPRCRDGKTVKGTNFFNPLENALLRALAAPHHPHPRMTKSMLLERQVLFDPGHAEAPTTAAV